MRTSFSSRMLATLALLSLVMLTLTACSTIQGSPILLKTEVKQVCLTNKELAALSRDSKIKLAQNNDLTGKKC